MESPRQVFKFPPPLPKFIPYGGPQVAKPRKGTLNLESAGAAEPVSVGGENEISNRGLTAQGSGSQDNPIEIDSDTSQSDTDESDYRDSDSSYDNGDDGDGDDDDDLPSVSDILRSSARPHDKDAADEPRRANIAVRRSPTLRSPTPSNDHNADTAGTEAEGGGADNRSQGDLSKADGADGVRNTEPPQSVALLTPNVALEGDGEQYEDNCKGNVDGEGFGMFGCCRQDGDDGGDGGAGGGASDDATSIAGGHDISRSLQSPPLLDATHENRKRRRELDGLLSIKRAKQAQQPDAISPAERAFSSQRSHESHESHSARACDEEDCDEEDGTEDHDRPQHPQAMRVNSCPSKQRKTGQVLSHTDPTTDYPHLNARGTSPTSPDEIASISCRGGECEVGAIADMGHADEEINIPANSTNRANNMVRSVNENADEDDVRPRLDGVESRQSALLEYTAATVPQRPQEDPVNIQNDRSVSHQPSAALGSTDERDVSATRDSSVVSTHQASGPEDKYNDINRDGQELRRPQNDGGPQQSLGSKPDGEDGRIRRRRPRRRSSYSVRRPAREGEGDQRISRRAKQSRIARLNGSYDSGDELERPISRRSSRLLRRQRVDTVSRNKDKHRVAGRLLPGLLYRPSNDPDPANPHLEVRGHDGEMQLDGSDKHPQTAPARVTHVTRVTIRPISRDASVLIALGRGDAVPMRYDNGVASAIEDAVGHAVKLASISIDPLPPGGWLLTGLVCGPDEGGGLQTGDDQLITQAYHAREKASQSELRPRPKPQSSGVRSSTEGHRPGGSDDDDSSSDASNNWQESSQECGENGKSDEESDGLGDSAWKSGHIKGSKWEDSEDDHLRVWVTQDARPKWKAIYRRFPKRTDGSVRLRGHHLRGKSAQDGKRIDR